MATAERITVNLIQRSADALRWLASQTGLNRTDVINRAIQLYRMVEEERAEGNELLLRNPAGEIAKVTLL